METSELKHAEERWIRKVQQFAFSSEIELLRKGKCILRSSKIIPFPSFIDEKGLTTCGRKIRIAEVVIRQTTPNDLALRPQGGRAVDSS